MPITKQTIAIIGAGGTMGSAIAKSVVSGNYRLLLFDRNTEELGPVIEQIKQVHSPEADVAAVNCAHECSWEADIIIMAVPYGAEKGVADTLRDVATQKVIISVSNPLNETLDGLVTPPGTSAAEELQRLLPNSKVVKAFNTTFAADFGQPVIGGKQIDAFIAGNDEEALEIVSELVRTAGFNPVLAGDLSVSGTLERMHLLLIQLNRNYKYNWLAGWKVLHN